MLVNSDSFLLPTLPFYFFLCIFYSGLFFIFFSLNFCSRHILNQILIHSYSIILLVNSDSFLLPTLPFYFFVCIFYSGLLFIFSFSSSLPFLFFFCLCMTSLYFLFYFFSALCILSFTSFLLSVFSPLLLSCGIFSLLPALFFFFLFTAFLLFSYFLLFIYFFLFSLLLLCCIFSLLPALYFFFFSLHFYFSLTSCSLFIFFSYFLLFFFFLFTAFLLFSLSF